MEKGYFLNDLTSSRGCLKALLTSRHLTKNSVMPHTMVMNRQATSMEKDAARPYEMKKDMARAGARRLEGLLRPSRRSQEGRMEERQIRSAGLPIHVPDRLPPSWQPDLPEACWLPSPAP